MAKQKSRISLLNRIRFRGGVTVVFEAPHRATSSLNDCLKVLGGDCSIFVGREFTKKFETLWWGNLKDYIAFRKEKTNNNPNALVGEYVWVLDLSNNHMEEPNFEQIELWVETLYPHLKPSILASVISRRFNVEKKTVYKKIMER